MSESADKPVTVTLDTDFAMKLDEVLRASLSDAGLIEGEETRSLRDARSKDGPAEAKLQLDAKTAATISQMLREGMIAASAAHQANNVSVASAVGKVIQP